MSIPCQPCCGTIAVSASAPHGFASAASTTSLPASLASGGGGGGGGVVFVGAGVVSVPASGDPVMSSSFASSSPHATRHAPAMLVRTTTKAAGSRHLVI